MINIPFDILEQCFAYGIASYPEESCGFISGNKEDEFHLEKIHPMQNKMNLFHAQDPALYPRTNKNAYIIDPKEQMTLERKLKKEGKRIKIIYHTHPDVGAYFSEKDQADALWNGEPRYPGIHYLVCGISSRQADGAILASFNAETKSFNIVRIRSTQSPISLSKYIASNLSTVNGISQFKHAEPIGGPHCITAELSTLEEILDWEEGLYEFDYGYYRFVDHADLHRLQAGLKHYAEVRHAVCYVSFQSALMELLDYLLQAKPQMTIKILIDSEQTKLRSLLDYMLQGLHTNVMHANSENPFVLEPFSENKEDILLIALEEPIRFIEKESEFLKQAKQRRLPIVVCSKQFPPKGHETALINYWICFLNQHNEAIEGGVILSNSDRQMTELKELRKQKGPILSSRNAAYFLHPSNEILDQPSRKEDVIQRLCTLEHAKYGFLFPSGMNAIATLFSLLRRNNKTQIISIGHLYTDTYTLLTYGRLRNGPCDNLFLHINEIDQLDNLITDQTAAILTETITNPLNDVADLEVIAKIAQKKKVPFIVDNTLATPFNCNPLDLGVDYVLHSTTKFLSGGNDHAGGAILVNAAEKSRDIQLFQSQWGNELSCLESQVLWEHLSDFEERMERFNQNALKISEFLFQHPCVNQVYFSALPTHTSYETACKLLRGTGSVISFVLKEDNLKGLCQFYNADLNPILKAPSLGSDHTLLCPYTLLAHYHESDEVLTELNLSRYLIRLAVGSEKDITAVISGLENGFAQLN